MAAAAKKDPTNAELLKEIRAMNGRVVMLEQWKIAEDAYRAALAKVKEDERESKADTIATDTAKRRTELMKQAGIVLGLIAAILYAYAATKGIATP